MNESSPDLRVVSTRGAAKILLRAEITLRHWACYGNGPIAPIRLGGRGSKLLWRMADIERLLGGLQAVSDGK